MRLVGVISTTVLSLTLGLAASAYAQEQHDQKEEEKAKPAQQDEKKASPDKPSQAEKKSAEKQKDNAGREEKATQQRNKDGKPEQTNERQQANERQQPQHTEQAQPEQRTKGGSDHGGGRIPEDRYRAHFGQEHKFHVSQADYGRDRRFQYGGYTFGFVDEWPGNWLYTQDVFVIEIDGVYYLCNPTYPGVNIALSVVL
jgi:phage repressor protein C with HTH and peptisase S24 domain